MIPSDKQYFEVESVNPANGMPLGMLASRGSAFDIGNVAPGNMCPKPIVLRIKKLPGATGLNRVHLVLANPGFVGSSMDDSATFFAAVTTWQGGADWVELDHTESMSDTSGTWHRLTQYTGDEASVGSASGVVAIDLTDVPVYVWIASFVGANVRGSTQAISLRFM